MQRGLTLAAVLILAAPTIAQTGDAPLSPYAGEEARDIAALSAEDIAELRRGGGWGLARAAELNGVPGPTHLLELRDEIGLTVGQSAALTTLRDTMRAAAIAEGNRLIAAERALDRAFTDAVPTPGQLGQLVRAAEAARADLRLVHLSAHLETPSLLTPDQIAAYNSLRGYTSEAGPCAEPPPQGHDVTLWRQHNGCD